MMGKATISIPLVTLRPDGLGGFRPRYIPGAHQRGLGLVGEDLRHPDGAWFTLDECARWSAARQQLVAELEAQASPKARRGALNAAAGITVGQLFEAWFKDPRLNGEELVEGKKKRKPLAAHTVRFYRNAANQLEQLDDGLIWASPANAISAKVLQGVLHRIEVKHGLATARGLRAAISVCFGWGKLRNHVAANPAKGLDEKLPVPPPRVRYGSIEEIAHLVKTADALEAFDVGDAIMLGVWSGQRQADRLSIDDYRVTPSGMLFHQHKKGGQPLLIPEARPLAERLEAARRRRAPWQLNYPHVLLDERLRTPWSAERYRKAFAVVREKAAETLPSLKDFHDQDLRDTAVTWLALAGVDAFGIASITGHSLDSINSILRHYLGMHPALARGAIGKLVAWFDQQGDSNG